jgi:hypothetical protein
MNSGRWNESMQSSQSRKKGRFEVQEWGEHGI